MKFTNSRYKTPNQSKENQTWAERSRASPKAPPLINFEALKETKKKYSNILEEVEAEFDKTKRWLGVRMTLAEVKKCVWCNDRTET